MKKIITNVILFVLFILLTTNVQAKSTINATLSSNTYNNQEIVVTFKYSKYEEITKGINAYKATLEYDEKIFEEVSKESFKLLNNWEGLEYNKDTKEFISIKKEGSKAPEDVIQITLKLKEEIEAVQTSIRIKNIVASEGIEDLDVNDTEIKIDINKDKLPTSTPENPDDDEDSNDDGNSNNNENPNDDENSNDNENPSEDETSNNQTQISGKEENKSDSLYEGKLPQTGLPNANLFIFLAIGILIVNIIIVRKKQKNIDRNINKNLKIFVTFLTIGIISMQSMYGIYGATDNSNSKGELNNDGQINDIDVNLLELHLIHLQSLPENKLVNADINNDNKITVTDLSLLLQMTGQIIEDEEDISKKIYKETTSMYSWHEQTLVEDATLIYQSLQELNVDTLYQSINSSYMKKEYLEPIIEDYQSQGIKVYRLMGDPSWAYNPESAKKRIDEINTYNQSVKETAQIKGVNLDIEPHVDEKWDENPEAAFTQYKNTMIELYNYAKQYDLEVTICTNTWFSSYEGHEELYEKAADTFSIMNYVKSSNIKGIKEEVELAEKYQKNIETVAHSSADSEETESYHNDGMDKLLKDHEEILKTYSYENLRASYHYFTTIEYLRDKDVYLQLKTVTVDDSEEVLDIVLIGPEGKEMEGYIMRLGDTKSYIFPGVKENMNYQVKSTSHVVINSDIITIPESPKGRATLTVELRKKSTVQPSTYTVMNDIDYAETLENIENPERGFYYPVRMDMKLDGNDSINPNHNLVHLRIGIGAFSGAVNGEKDLQFTEDMLNALNETLANIKKNGGSAIVRFAYDNFDGEENLEPSLDMILTHISQLKPVFNNNKDVIAYIELGFFGPWGEMHSSNICTTENVSKAIDEMLKSAPSQIKIGVRTPKYYAAWAKVDRTKLDTDITIEGTNNYRIGLYNDGYLGSESDLGTFENRETEIRWLEKQALHTLYGGEVVANYAEGTPLNTIEYISKEGFRTHTTYLNSQWNDSVIDSWKTEIYNGDDELYKGQTGYLYVANHLGYRFVLRKSQITSNIEKNETLKLKLDIENVGFGNLVNDKIVTVVLEKDGKTYETITNLDATTWNSNEISNINLEIELPEDIQIGQWNVYLRISQNGDLNTDNNYNCIRLANNGIWKQDIGANYIGKIQVVI